MLKKLLLIVGVIAASNCYTAFDILQPLADIFGLGNANRALDQFAEKAQDIFVTASKFCPPVTGFCKGAQLIGETISVFDQFDTPSEAGKVLAISIPTIIIDGKQQFVNLRTALQIIAENNTDQVQDSINAVKQYLDRKLTNLKQGINTTQSLIETNLNKTDQILHQVNTMSQELITIQNGIEGINNNIGNIQSYLTNVNDNIINGMANLSSQINDLKTITSQGQQQIFAALQQGVCFQTMQGYERTILTQMTNLQNYAKAETQEESKTPRDQFLSGCDNCQTSLDGLLSGMGGTQNPFFDCNILDILYNAAPNNNYTKGNRTQILERGAYLLNLINQGVAVNSAYQVMQNNNTAASTYLQKSYNADLVKIVDNILNTAQKCVDEMWININDHIQGMSSTFGQDKSNQDIALVIFDYLNNVYPWQNWTVVALDGPVTSQYYDSIAWFFINQVVKTINNQTTILITGFPIAINSTMELVTDNPIARGTLSNYANYLWQKDEVSGVLLLEQTELYQAYVISDTYNSYVNSPSLQIIWRSTQRQGHSEQVQPPSNTTSNNGNPPNNSETNQNITILQQQIDALTQSNSQFQNNITDLQNQITKLTQQNSDLKQQNDACELQYTTLTTELNQDPLYLHWIVVWRSSSRLDSYYNNDEADVKKHYSDLAQEAKILINDKKQIVAQYFRSNDPNEAQWTKSCVGFAAAYKYLNLDKYDNGKYCVAPNYACYDTYDEANNKFNEIDCKTQAKALFGEGVIQQLMGYSPYMYIALGEIIYNAIGDVPQVLGF